MLADDRRHRGRAEPHAALVDSDADELGDTLEVDEDRWMLHAGAVLNEQVGPAGEQLRGGIGLHQTDGVGNRFRRFVTWALQEAAP